MKAPTMALAAVLLASTALAQEPQPQVLFESGQYDRTIAALQPELAGAADPWNHYLAVQAYLRLAQPAQAATDLQALVASEDPAWRLVGQSLQALNTGDTRGAIDLGNQAVAANPELFVAHYQLGLSKARAEDWAGAADAFEQAASLNPSFAYSYYYAGLSYSRIRRADKTAEYFERFLTLAPSAPERAGVQSIMRTLRGQ